MVRKHMPNSMATARGHLNKTRVAQPPSLSQSVSALRRNHARTKTMLENLLQPHDKYEAAIALQLKAGQQNQRHTSPSVYTRFDPTSVPRSTTIHLDYTGRLPQRGSKGTLYFLVACWGSYIHFEPLTTMKGPATATAVKSAVLFFRKQNVHLDTIRMDNQSSPEIKQTAEELDLQLDLVNPHQKEPNRAPLKIT